jgi:hypothetical protein
MRDSRKPCARDAAGQRNAVQTHQSSDRIDQFRAPTAQGKPMPECKVYVLNVVARRNLED